MLGPELGGLVALGMIGSVASFIAWLNCGSCKLGRHDWSNWMEPKEKKFGVIQERHCKKCNQLAQRTGGCSLNNHDWAPWKRVGALQERSCNACNKIEQQAMGCEVGNHDWAPWESVDGAQTRHCNVCNQVESHNVDKCSKGDHEWNSWSKPVYTGMFYKETNKKIFRQDRSCKLCNASESKTSERWDSTVG